MEQSMNGVPVSTLREVVPSPDDVAVTRAFVNAGKMMDIEIIDHLIICAGGKWTSLKERGLGFS
jgi:DNA repair protein RadC